MVRTWTREILRAGVASMIAPVVLLVGAALVAAGAGGLGGLSSLTQIASGPELPDAGVELAGEPSFRDADVAGIDDELLATAPPPTASAASAPGDGAVAASPGAATGPATFSPPGGDIGTDEPPPVAFVPDPPARRPGDDSPPPPAPPADPVQSLLDATRGLGDAVPEPLRPITDDVLNDILAPR